MEVNEVVDALADVGWQGPEADQGRGCLAYTPNEDLAHRTFVRLAEEIRSEAESAGMRVDIESDPFGNTYVTLVGESERRIMICSHLDSVPRGGRYDGMVGVSGGLDVLRRFVRAGEKPGKSVQVAAFRAEESSVTGKSMLGSALAVGALGPDDLGNLHHSMHGKNMLEVLAERGLDPERLATLEQNPYDRSKLGAVFEMHIEQSGVLEAANEAVGIVVHGIGGARRSMVIVGEKDDDGIDVSEKSILRITINGAAGHSGGTPMNDERLGNTKLRLRRDALHALAQFLPNVRDKRVVKIETPGGSFNTIPGQCIVDIAIDDESEAQKIMGILTEKVDGRRFTLQTEIFSPEERRISAIRESTVDAAMSVICECGFIGRDMAIETGGLVRATVGNIARDGGSLHLSVDERRLDNEKGDEMNRRMDEVLGQIGGYDGTAIHVPPEHQLLTLATPFPDPQIQQLMRDVYMEIFDRVPVEMGSMPGHNCAVVIRGRGEDRPVPGGMIFVRGLNGGISHNPAEKSSPEDIQKGADFLYRVVERLCA
jgi:acetylornithine deacetylase/succinyl-diaminopimelate desuccinylase-like protein